jgi:hypothetical protein
LDALLFADQDLGRHEQIQHHVTIVTIDARRRVNKRGKNATKRGGMSQRIEEVARRYGETITVVNMAVLNVNGRGDAF